MTSPPHHNIARENEAIVVDLATQNLPVIGTIRSGVDFVRNPGWGAAASIGVSLIPVGKVAGAAGKVFGRTCFVAGTPVLVRDRALKPIEEVAVGDLVWSRPELDEAGGEVAGPRQVVDLSRTEDQPIWSVRALSADGRVETYRATVTWEPGATNLIRSASRG